MKRHCPLHLSWHSLVVFVLLMVGLGVRWINLTNPPLDFHAARQLSGAIIARGIYSQWAPNLDTVEKQTAIEIWKNLEASKTREPPIMESIVAITYLVIGVEHLWIARIYATLFWVCGGVALYLLSRRLSNSFLASIFALAFYLFTPFGVVASRSFQPDPFMIMWLLWALYALWRWTETKNWKWALLTGLLLGVAVLTKPFALFMLLPVLVIAILSVMSPRQAIRNKQVWAIILVSASIPISYYLFTVAQHLTGYFSFWSLSFLKLFLKPRFYFAWLDTVGCVIGKNTVFLSLASCLLLPWQGRRFAIGLWLGYGLYGALVPYLMATHDYYHLVTIPIASISLLSILEAIGAKFLQQKRIWQTIFLALCILYTGYQILLVRNALVSSDYHEEIKGWIKMGQAIPRDGKIIALTHDYGWRIAYYGLVDVTTWPYVGDWKVLALRSGGQGSDRLQEDEFEQYFAARTEGYKYFLVTQFGELEAQPLLKAKLYNHYSIAQQGDGYVLFDLTKPLSDQ